MLAFKLRFLGICPLMVAEAEGSLIGRYKGYELEAINLQNAMLIIPDMVILF